jgi:CNT family concentrative nucleoside transporter
MRKSGLLLFFLMLSCVMFGQTGVGGNPSEIIDSEAIEEGNRFVRILRGSLGIFTLIIIGWVFSSNRKKISWPLVFKALGIQLLLAFSIIHLPIVKDLFDSMSRGFVWLLSFSDKGAEFLFGSLVTDAQNLGTLFAFKVLPTVVFFSAITAVLFYLGILQQMVKVFAWMMRKSLGLSGAESLAAVGNVFLGQTEAPLLVRPYIENMTRSELMCLMAGGMSTIAGGVLAAFIGFLGNGDPVMEVFFAKHLIAASVMSAPAAVLAAKMMIPETGEVHKEATISRQEVGTNILEAITNGTTQGLRLAVNVGVMLLVFVAFIYLINAFLYEGIGEWTGLNDWVQAASRGRFEGLSMQAILGFILAPISWLMGVPSEDVLLVGQLLGEKTVLNEFVAYISLSDLKNAGQFSSQQSIIIATYMLCGFSNFASIGIQIGGVGALAPGRRRDLSQLGFRALIAGTLASLYTAAVVGMMI